MSADRNPRLLIKTGLWFGLGAGILGGVNAVTSPALVGVTGEKVIFYIVIFSVAALALGSGVIAARISNRLTTGLWVGLLVGVVASLIANTTRVGYSIAFYNIVRNDPGEIRDWMQRGSGSFVDYLIDDRIGGFFYTTLFLGLMCAVCGMFGGLIGKARGMRRAG